MLNIFSTSQNIFDDGVRHSWRNTWLRVTVAEGLCHKHKWLDGTHSAWFVHLPGIAIHFFLSAPRGCVSQRVFTVSLNFLLTKGHLRQYQTSDLLLTRFIVMSLACSINCYVVALYFMVWNHGRLPCYGKYINIFIYLQFT